MGLEDLNWSSDPLSSLSLSLHEEPEEPEEEEEGAWRRLMATGWCVPELRAETAVMLAVEEIGVGMVGSCCTGGGGGGGGGSGRGGSDAGACNCFAFNMLRFIC